MRANSAQLNLNDDRQKEYQRQQERLKAMAASNDKVKSVSADLMIENLLKDSFKKQSKTPTQLERPDHLYLDLPPWLQCESSIVPAQYKYLWSLVQSTIEMADTQKVSQLLLTSGLHVDVLGFIWNLANKAVPGQLTKQEFYIVLALVGLAQTGCTFNNLSVLKLIPAPSIPALQVNMLKNQVAQSFNPSNDLVSVDSCQQTQNLPIDKSMHLTNLREREKPYDSFGNNTVNETLFYDNAFDVKKEVSLKKEKSESNLVYSNSIQIKTKEPHTVEMNKGPYKSSNFPCIGSSPTAEMEDDFSEFQSVAVFEKPEVHEKVNYSSGDSIDDFTDFQSANVEHLDPFETVVITQKREIPKIPLPKSLTGKLSNFKSNILKISPESEKRLKILSQSESLSSLPESKISSSNKVSTSISVIGSNHGIGSRLANHSLGAKLDRSKHHKHHKIKISAGPATQSNSEDDIILGVKPTNIENLIPKCCPKKSNDYKTFVLKETKIKNDEIPEPSTMEQIRNEYENQMMNTGENTRRIEIPMLGTFNETVLPTQTKTQPVGIDLISVQEDKYSALREVEIEMIQEKTSKSSNPAEEEMNDEFGDFLSADIPPPPAAPAIIPATSDSTTEAFFSRDDEKECWTDWKFNTETSLTPADFSLPELSNPEITDLKEYNEPPVKVEGDLFDSFDLLTLSENENTKPSSDINSTEPMLDVFSEIELDNTMGSNLVKNDDVLNCFDIFETGKNEKTNGLPTQSKPVNKSQSDNEFWDFLTIDMKPPVTNGFSRHGSLPSLDLKMSATDESEQEIIWRKCLDSCFNLIQEGFEIFNNITVKSVLDEIFGTPKTVKYLNSLNIAYQISKRISQNFELSSNQDDLDRIWGRLEELCLEYNIKLKPDEDKASVGKIQCNICLGYIKDDLITQGNSTYHPSCANLWINCIEGTLPFST